MEQREGSGGRAESESGRKGEREKGCDGTGKEWRGGKRVEQRRCLPSSPSLAIFFSFYSRDNFAGL